MLVQGARDRQGQSRADAFIAEPADAAEVDGEEFSDLLAEEPECTVPENVQELDEQELLRALVKEPFVATAKSAEQAPAVSGSSGTAAQPTDKKRATYRRLAAAGLLRKPPAKGFLLELEHLLPAARPRKLSSGASKKQHTRRPQQRAP